jgi:hypothetical protein
MPQPFHLDLILRPGETFGPYVFFALTSGDDPMDLTGWTPYAEFRLTTTGAVVFDLAPYLLGDGSVGAFTADDTTSVLTCTGHGLIAGQCVQFTSDDTLPSPLESDTDYFVMAFGLETDEFLVSAAPGDTAVIILDTGTGTHTVSSILGQIAIPQIAWATSHDYTEKSGGYDFILQDTNGKRWDGFGGGNFAIKKGFTNPV